MAGDHQNKLELGFQGAVTLGSYELFGPEVYLYMEYVHVCSRFKRNSRNFQFFILSAHDFFI